MNALMTQAHHMMDTILRESSVTLEMTELAGRTCFISTHGKEELMDDQPHYLCKNLLILLSVSYHQRGQYHNSTTAYLEYVV